VQLAAGTDGLDPGTAVLWSIRPEQVVVRPADRGDGGHPATVTDVADLGTATTLTVQLAGGTELRVRTTAGVALRAGDRCTVTLPADAVSVWADTAAHDEPVVV
jgi:ABC-type Fe3+/spermidine/putrescine transport system ATPase subunit